MIWDLIDCFLDAFLWDTTFSFRFFLLWHRVFVFFAVLSRFLAFVSFFPLVICSLALLLSLSMYILTKKPKKYNYL